MEKLILMPLKAYTPPMPAVSSSPTSISSTVLASSQAAQLARRERRHDSGSDSGTELGDGDLSGGEGNVPQEIFLLLEKTYGIIICRQHDDRDRDCVVRQFFRLVERRCLRREAFTTQHKNWFHTWLKRMDKVWEISKSEAAVEGKRR